MNAGDLHVIPLGDLQEHKQSEYCWCEPTRKVEGWCEIFIHHANDGREKYEKGELKPH